MLVILIISHMCQSHRLPVAAAENFFYKFSDGKAFPIRKKSSDFVEYGKYFYSEYVFK